MCVTDCHDMTLAVKVALNPNTTNQLMEDSGVPLVIDIAIFQTFDNLKLKLYAFLNSSS